MISTGLRSAPEPAVRRLRQGSAFAFADAAQRLERTGRSVIHLELGAPRFMAPPAALTALDAALSEGSEYTPPAGYLDVREQVARHYSTVLARPVQADEVLLVPGSNMVLYCTLMATLTAGDQVLVPDPGFPPYAELVRLAGGAPIGYPLRAERGFQPDVAEIDALISERTRMIVLNSPHNPTGTVLARNCVAQIRALARDRGLLLVVDDAYRELAYDDDRPAPADRYPTDQLVVMDTLSKSHAMAGWRVGIAIASPAMVRDMAAIMTNLNCCMPSFIQRSIPAALAARDAVRSVVSQCRARRDLVVAELATMPLVKLCLPRGALYAFPDIRATGLSAELFAERLLHEAGVALVPGTVYGHQGRGHVRIAFTQPPDLLAEGMSRIRTFLEAL